LGSSLLRLERIWDGELRGRQQTSSVRPIVVTGQKWGKERGKENGLFLFSEIIFVEGII
jgi:hypothetical protein